MVWAASTTGIPTQVMFAVYVLSTDGGLVEQVLFSGVAPGRSCRPGACGRVGRVVCQAPGECERPGSSGKDFGGRCGVWVVLKESYRRGQGSLRRA